MSTHSLSSTDTMVEAAANVHFHKILQNDSAIQLACLEQGEGEPLLYLHGWGRDRHAFLPLIETLGNGYRHVAVDCPGFGQSSPPPGAWGTDDYAACFLQLADALQLERFTVVGHSFGGRVALRMAVRTPERIAAMILISAAGLKRRAPWMRRFKVAWTQRTARLAHRLLPPPWGERIKQRLYNRIASRDYLQAGDMRPTFVKVVQEDLAPLLPNIQTPALLLWGADDTETPPELGRRLHKGLRNSMYLEFEGFDHHSILDRGRHQIGHQITQYLSQIAQEDRDD